LISWSLRRLRLPVRVDVVVVIDGITIVRPITGVPSIAIIWITIN